MKILQSETLSELLHPFSELTRVLTASLAQIRHPPDKDYLDSFLQHRIALTVKIPSSRYNPGME